MKIFLRVLFGLILAGVIVGILLRAVSVQDMTNAIHALSWTSIACIIAIVFGFCVVKALRFFFILRFGGIDVSLRNTIRIFIASQFLSPIPGGEVGRAMIFKKELDIHLNEIAGPVFLQALMELWSATLWVVLAAFFVGSFWSTWIVGLVILLAILSVPLLCSKQLPRFFDMLKARGMTYAWIDKTKITFQNFQKLISPKEKTHVWRFWILTTGLGLCAHAASGVLLWYIAYVAGVHITLLQGIFTATMATLIQGIVTIVPGGLGFTEGGLVGVLTSFAVPWKKTVAITLLYRIATLPLLLVIALLFLIPLVGKNLLHKKIEHATQQPTNL